MTIDITVGAVDRPGDARAQADRGATGASVLEARVLSVRRPRRSAADVPGERRQRQSGPARDPLGARVVTLLIAEGHLLPENVVKGGYRAVVRFVKR